LLIAAKLATRRSQPLPPIAMFAYLEAIGQLVVALALAPILITRLALSLLVGILPMPEPRRVILAAQSTLTATIGDSLAFVESPARAALIRTCILDRLERLRRLCEHTVIVAHSQGAAVALDALGRIIERNEKRAGEAASHLVPDTLVTFGAGTNQLASQKELSAGRITKKFGMDPVFGALGAMAIAVVIVLFLYPDLGGPFNSEVQRGDFWR
jgi:hypothetical protein